MKVLGIKHWYKDEDYLTATYRLAEQPTVNIQGLVSGYMGPGGKTVLAGPRRGQDRPAAGARHDQGRGGVEAEGASRQARLRRHRGQCQRRLRPDPDRREQSADQGRAGDAGGGEDPDDHVGALGGKLAGRGVHRAAAANGRRPVRRRARRRRPCARRMAADRQQQSQGARLRRAGDPLRRLPLRSGADGKKR